MPNCSGEWFIWPTQVNEHMSDSNSREQCRKIAPTFRVPKSIVAITVLQADATKVVYA